MNVMGTTRQRSDRYRDLQLFCLVYATLVLTAIVALTAVTTYDISFVRKDQNNSFIVPSRVNITGATELVLYLYESLRHLTHVNVYDTRHVNLSSTPAT